MKELVPGVLYYDYTKVNKVREEYGCPIEEKKIINWKRIKPKILVQLTSFLMRYDNMKDVAYIMTE